MARTSRCSRSRCRMRRDAWCRSRDNEVTFRVTGPGKLIGVGNGDPTNQESDKGTARKAFSGRCMAIVQSTKIPGAISGRGDLAGAQARIAPSRRRRSCGRRSRCGSARSRRVPV